MHLHESDSRSITLTDAQFLAEAFDLVGGV